MFLHYYCAIFTDNIAFTWQIIFNTFKTLLQWLQKHGIHLNIEWHHTITVGHCRKFKDTWKRDRNCSICHLTLDDFQANFTRFLHEFYNRRTKIVVFFYAKNLQANYTSSHIIRYLLRFSLKTLQKCMISTCVMSLSTLNSPLAENPQNMFWMQHQS